MFLSLRNSQTLGETDKKLDYYNWCHMKNKSKGFCGNTESNIWLSLEEIKDDFPEGVMPSLEE